MSGNRDEQSVEEVETWLRELSRLTPVPLPLLREGRIIAERYRVLSHLGAGGMGVVYLGERLADGLKVAVKQLRTPDDVERSIRFVRESIAPSRIESPHVVGVLDRGQLADAGAYLVMEYLEGPSLEQAIASTGPFPLPRALHVARQIAEALSAAHRVGIAHRDLKPANVLLVLRLGDPDFVKLVDFGIAKYAIALDSKASDLTATGAQLGTPAYMAPEQIRGERDVGAPADIYSLGVVLFEMLTSRRPYGLESPDARLEEIGSGRLPRVRASRPELPQALDDLLGKALAPRREDRYPTLQPLLEDLRRISYASG